MHRMKIYVALILLIFVPAVLHAFSVPMINPAEVLKTEVSYIVQSQLTCGAWNSCTEPLYSPYLFFGGMIYPFNSTEAKLTVLYMDSLTLGSTDFSTFIPSIATYQFPYVYPLLNALWALAYGYGKDQSYTVSLAESWILKNFGTNGITSQTATDLSSVYGESTYDYMTTMVALMLAYRSQYVDGVLSGDKLNATLDPNFWVSLNSTLLNPPSTAYIGTTPMFRYWVMSFAIMLNPAIAKTMCSGPVNQMLQEVLNEYETGTLTTYSYFIYIRAKMLNIWLCHYKYGYFNETDVENALKWLFQEAIASEGKLGFSSVTALNDNIFSIYLMASGLYPTLYIIGDPTVQKSTQLAHQEYQLYLEALNGNPMPITEVMNNIVVTKTTTQTIVVPEKVPIPAPALLGVLVASIRKKVLSRK